MDQLSECNISRKLKKVIEKACSFEPDKRYTDASELSRAIEKCQKNSRKTLWKKTGAAVGLIAAGYILAVLFPGMKMTPNERIAATDQNTAEVLQTAAETQDEETEQTAEKTQNPEQVQNVEQSQNNPVVFKEALIEKAVRKELNLSETDTITASMLEDVRKLRIVGKEILEDEDTFWGEGHHVNGKDSSFGSVRGDIKNLSDLAQMTNLGGACAVQSGD